MTTTVEAVRRHLEEDPALVDVLLRDLVNLRRTARWLIADHGWDATEEAVVSALRRYREGGGDEAVWAAREDLRSSELELRDGLALVSIPRTPEIQRTSLEAWFDTDGTGLIGVLPGRTETRLLVEERSVRDLTEEAGALSIRDVEAPVAVLRVVSPDTSKDAGLLSLVLGALAHHRIDPIEVTSCNPEWLLVIPDRKVLDAHGILGGLTKESSDR